MNAELGLNADYYVISGRKHSWRAQVRLYASGVVTPPHPFHGQRDTYPTASAFSLSFPRIIHQAEQPCRFVDNFYVTGSFQNFEPVVHGIS